MIRLAHPVRLINFAVAFACSLAFLAWFLNVGTDLALAGAWLTACINDTKDPTR
ncbi:hypothetical protein [Patulibacter minatonensis]|uniref:hypothetical protein n=1 Tax=Patulibacter minatonensis TaxID=298163 RepID=UPI0004B93C09|nr:hypothetical protein [Patulibacter minatonensis]